MKNLSFQKYKLINYAQCIYRPNNHQVPYPTEVLTFSVPI
jgi:hypothetical protein